jgi:hypothetical protein
MSTTTGSSNSRSTNNSMNAEYSWEVSHSRETSNWRGSIDCRGDSSSNISSLQQQKHQGGRDIHAKMYALFFFDRKLQTLI